MRSLIEAFPADLPLLAHRVLICEDEQIIGLVHQTEENS